MGKELLGAVRIRLRIRLRQLVREGIRVVFVGSERWIVNQRSHLASVVCVGVDCAVKESVQPIAGEIVIRVPTRGSALPKRTKDQQHAFASLRHSRYKERHVGGKPNESHLRCVVNKQVKHFDDADGGCCKQSLVQFVRPKFAWCAGWPQFAIFSQARAAAIVHPAPRL